MSPRVSIVIPVFNQASFTAACLGALAADEEVRAGAEVIVVNNASTDETRSVLEQARGKVAALEVIHLDTNTGFAPASNLGGERARAPQLVMLNNDTVPQPGWLGALENALNLPRAGIVGPKLIYPHSGLVNHGGYVHGSIAGGFYALYHCFPADFAGVNRRRDFQALLGACVMLRTEHFRSVGGFGNFGLEDIDLCFKIRALGLRVIYEPRATVLHHGSVTLKNSAPGTLPDADTLEFSARWPKASSIVDDDVIFYREDGFQLVGMQGDAPELAEAVTLSLQTLTNALRLRVTGDLAGAEAQLTAALTEWLGNGEAWQELIALYFDQRRLPEALEAGRMMVQHLGTPAARLLVADLHRQFNHPEVARELIAEILADRGADPEDVARARVIAAAE